MEKINLTEIHKLKGSGRKNRPGCFLRMLNCAGEEVETIKGRYGGGTFASPRIAAMYERWLEDGVQRSFRAMMDKESAALDTIEQVLGVTLDRQYKVSSFRIDGYDKENNIAYEIDEGHHQTTVNYARDKRREKKIKEAIGCKFVRIKV